MKRRGLRWLLFFAAFLLLLWSVFVSVSIWSVAAFFACGAAWYWLTWKRTRELDAIGRK